MPKEQANQTPVRSLTGEKLGTVQVKKRSTKIHSAEKDDSTSKSIKSKMDRAYTAELSERMPTHDKRQTEEEEWAEIALEVGAKLKEKRHIEMSELVVMPLSETRNILQSIQAPSVWSAYFDLQTYPHIEVYSDNEDYRDHVPYFKSCLDLRAEMSVGVGFEIRDDTSEETSPQEEYIRSEFDRLDINTGKLIPTQVFRDLYGNGYWHLKWNKTQDGEKYVEKIINVFPKRIRVRLGRQKGSPIIGYAYMPAMFVIGQIPSPVPLDLKSVIHFKGDIYDDRPYGHSKVKGLEEILRARWDLNILLPIYFKHYAKPWIHWSYNSEGRVPKQIKNDINDMFGAIEEAGPDSDMITTNAWTATTFGAGAHQKDPKTFIEDLDGQMFGALKVPETYFKPKGTTDRMILRQDDNFKREMGRIQGYFSKVLLEDLIKQLCQLKFGPQFKTITDPTTGEKTEAKQYEVPEVVWNELFEEEKKDKSERVRADFQSGIITINEARKETDRDPMEDDQLGELIPSESMDMLNQTVGPEGELNLEQPNLNPTQLNQPVFNAPELKPPMITATRREVVETADVKVELEDKGRGTKVKVTEKKEVK